MPLFYIHHWCGDEHIPDPAGCDYADLDAARREAIRGARCIMSAEVKCGELRLDQHLELCDESGERLMNLDFADALAISYPQPADKASQSS